MVGVIMDDDGDGKSLVTMKILNSDDAVDDGDDGGW